MDANTFFTRGVSSALLGVDIVDFANRTTAEVFRSDATWMRQAIETCALRFPDDPVGILVQEVTAWCEAFPDYPPKYDAYAQRIIGPTHLTSRLFTKIGKHPQITATLWVPDENGKTVEIKQHLFGVQFLSIGMQVSAGEGDDIMILSETVRFTFDYTEVEFPES